MILMGNFKLAALLFVLSLLLPVGCGESEEKGAFSELTAALTQRKDANQESFDLQSSIRVIYALEQAVKEIKDFEEFARFLARYDFDNVASDVIEAQTKLVPVLREMFDSGAAKEENESAWRAFQDFQGPATLALGGAVASLSGDPRQGTIQLLKASSSAITQASEKYIRDKQVASRVKKAQRAYTAYLESSAAVYIKYMKMWDEFCVIRDEAYLSIHHGNYDDAVIYADKALAISPLDRESMLLKVFGGLMSSNLPNSLGEVSAKDDLEPYDAILAKYLHTYPDYSAPALLLQGIIQNRRGNTQKAIMLFDESAIQYPKQAKKLLEMMEPYASRGIFGSSAESSFVLELYKSTMEGFGAFSPNFHKAEVYFQQNNLDAAQEEIRMHFFRRGEQVVQDYLPTDLTFCQQHIPEVINSLFVEKPFIDVVVEEGGVLDEDNSLYVKLKNNSNRTLENVRLFLCVHFTDTYRNTYEVFRLPNALNKLPAFTEKEYEDPVIVNFEYRGKPKEVLDDVVHVRGVLVTDDIVTWVDSDDFKLRKAQESIRGGSDAPDELIQIAEAASIRIDEGYVYTTVNVEFNRDLVEFNPYVSLNELNLAEAIYPRDRRITSEKIQYTFSTTDDLTDLKFLHLSCDLGDIKVPLKKTP